MAKARHFRKADLPFVTARTASGDTSVARTINAKISVNMGGGLEILEGVSIRWTVTYDEILFIHEGRITIRTGVSASTARRATSSGCRTGRRWNTTPPAGAAPISTRSIRWTGRRVRESRNHRGRSDD